MDEIRNAVLFMDEPFAGLDQPMMLEEVLGSPVLTWMGKKLVADGVQRVFLVCSSAWQAAAKACFPEGAELICSDEYQALMDFLDMEEPVLVMSRAALPLEEAGIGFAYKVQSSELRETWQASGLGANVQGAVSVGGWVPLLAPIAIKEMEPILRQRQGK